MHKDNNGITSSSSSSGRIRHRRKSNEIPSEASKENGNHLLVNDQNKYRSFLIRAHSSVWMIGGFALVIYMGHMYIWAMVVVIQIFMVKELFNLLRKAHEDRHLPGFRLLNWHFFFTAMLFVYGRILRQQLVNTVTSDKVLYKLTSFTVANIFEGILWFLLPASLIVINDIAAYIFGFFFGRTPLIKLSPKKTWEGFLGASVTTMISAFVDLSTGWLHCDPSSIFKPEYYSLLGWFPEWFPWKEVSILPVQWHALCLGLFASIIAPFGGFFASGFKRAFKVKDFGDSIPGHGGITDRMDCQMVMAVFAYIYHQSFIVPQNYSVEMILDQIMRNLSFEEQRALYIKLGQIFVERQFGES
ncbi:hypothetical protein Sjap_001834 [Stephania japonica]|uniref:Phosphatidate cytidylyltransferase n=1 Tax=Stephania japonica TaxID=461633 RepID=A0AAP0KMG2_9MAGN